MQIDDPDVILIGSGIMPAAIMPEVLTNCLPHLLETKHRKSILKQMIPTYNESLVPDSMANRFGQVRQAADVAIHLADTDAPEKYTSASTTVEGFQP